MIRISFVAPPAVNKCALDISTQVKKPPQTTTPKRPLLTLKNKFKRFYRLSYLTAECSQDKHITPFSSTIFAMPVYFPASMAGHITRLHGGIDLEARTPEGRAVIIQIKKYATAVRKKSLGRILSDFRS